MPDAPLNKPTYRRAADVSAARLGRAMLGYLAAVTLIITLAPFRFAVTPQHGLSSVWDWSDVIMNVVMFVPIGFCFQLTRPAGTPVRWTHVATMGMALSGIIEIAQLFESTRYSSPVDVATNTLGAIVGAAVHGIATKRIEGRRTVRTLALELPLTGLVYLLVPLVWLTGLASAGDARGWLVLLIVAFVAGIMGTVYAAYLAPARHTQRGWLVVTVLGWYAVALLPGGIRQRDVLLAGAAIAIGIAWMRSLATSRDRERPGTRRFELPTLRLVMPLFAAYLALSSLWPLDDAGTSWAGMIPLLVEGETTTRSVFVALEHVAAFTLVGYLIAEYHGRDVEDYREIVGRVVAWGGGLSVLLELVRGFHPAYRASALMVVFTIGAAAFGAWLYQLQRNHVRALLTRRGALGAISESTSFDRGAPAPAFP
jgi:glycopeptide antibiotics resistance protein